MLGQLLLLPALAAGAGASSAVNTTVCNGQKYVYQELAGYGFLPSDARDRFGDSMSLGSAIALDRKTWSRRGDTYEGILYALPGEYLHQKFSSAVVTFRTNYCRSRLEYQRHAQLPEQNLQTASQADAQRVLHGGIAIRTEPRHQVSGQHPADRSSGESPLGPRRGPSRALSDHPRFSSLPPINNVHGRRLWRRRRARRTPHLARFRGPRPGARRLVLDQRRVRALRLPVLRPGPPAAGHPPAGCVCALAQWLAEFQCGFAALLRSGVGCCAGG